MSLWLEIKYANLMSSALERYKVKKQKPFNASFRCPICGDSKTNKLKTRGHFLEHKGTLFFKCHNCSASSKFERFLKTQNFSLFNEYKLEYLKEMGEGVQAPRYVPEIDKFSRSRADNFDPLKDLKKMSQLRHDHPAKKYVEDRLIPSSVHYKLYYAPRFFSWVNKHLPGKFSAGIKEEPRLVLPLIDENGYVFAATARSFDKNSKSKYITVKFKEEARKFYGLSEFKRDTKGYVVEGPLDSLFLSNCLAMCGSDADVDSLGLTDKTTIVFDNEPRNKEIVKKIETAIAKGYRVCLWPETPGKDINEMVQRGWLPKNIEKVIDENSFSGLEAKLNFMRWRKI